MRLLAAVLAAFVAGSGMGIVAGSSATIVHPDIHIAPGERVTIIADGPTPTPTPTDSPSPTASPTVAGPACTTRINGQAVYVDATGLAPGEPYGMWWAVHRDGVGTPVTYYGGSSAQMANADGWTQWIYSLRSGYTEVYIEPGSAHVHHPELAIAECEYTA